MSDASAKRNTGGSTENAIGRWLPSLSVLIAGGLVSWLALAARGFQQQAVWPAAAIPFVVTRVLVVHLLCTIPLSFWFATLAYDGIHRGSPPARPRKQAIAGVLLGLAFAVGVWFSGPFIASIAAESGPLGNDLVRLTLSSALWLPWCWCAIALLRGAGWTGRLQPIDILIAGLIATLPIIHVQQVTRRQTQVVTDQVINQQFFGALANCRQLVEMGREQIGDQDAEDLLAGLEQQVARLSQQVSTPLVEGAPDTAKLERARQLYSLGCLSEAEAALGPLVESEPEAAIRLALVREVEGNWSDAAERYRKVLDMLAARRPLDARGLQLLRVAQERRANNLRRINASHRAEQELQTSAEEWPEIEATTLLQLGFHYQMAGRTTEAVEYFRRAVQADPKYQQQVDVELERMKNQAQGCLIRSTYGVQR